MQLRSQVQSRLPRVDVLHLLARELSLSLIYVTCQLTRCRCRSTETIFYFKKKYYTRKFSTLTLKYFKVPAGFLLKLLLLLLPEAKFNLV